MIFQSFIEWKSVHSPSTPCPIRDTDLIRSAAKISRRITRSERMSDVSVHILRYRRGINRLAFMASRAALNRSGSKRQERVNEGIHPATSIRSSGLQVQVCPLGGHGVVTFSLRVHHCPRGQNAFRGDASPLSTAGVICNRTQSGQERGVQGETFMSLTKLVISILAVALVLFILLPKLSWGEDRPPLSPRLAACERGPHAARTGKRLAWGMALAS